MLLGQVMRIWRQTTERWQEATALQEFARAIAFANLDLTQPRAVIAMQAPAVPREMKICQHEPFQFEVVRAMRRPPKEAPTLRGFQPLRPIYGLETAALVIEAQARMRRVLDDILSGDPSTFFFQAREIKLSVDELAGIGSGRDIRIGVIYGATPGYSNILYGVLLGGERGYWRRLARCRACGRYTLGKTDRPVRYCADPECQTHSTRPTGAAPSADAAYQRVHRARGRKWDRFKREAWGALQERPSPTARLADLAVKGRRLLDECFKRPTEARNKAERLLVQLEHGAGRDRRRRPRP